MLYLLIYKDLFMLVQGITKLETTREWDDHNFFHYIAEENDG